MTRVKRGSVARKYRKNILDFVSGFRGAHSKLFRTANQRRGRSLAYAYVDKNNSKRAFRRLWIARINAAARRDGITYSSVIHSLYKNRIALNRKTLAQIATLDAYCFSMIIEKVSKIKI
uniref:Large ribosomal subunit protein bL20c n=1 Tax=Adiantum capillus-veneris TaxID=13818 RepID=RK20_ADICA|nr:ribosomal protein L20 [Adiantum capillus-veneris]Q85FJ9.2 RecName: Full=Large ribosomal subunit protein bL20c; AltName: Full=50S ribosomal protein L20, chloroplastic [Adiantum capillus-veneris]AAP29414.2 ribosomal protein L20 [Adiantum capillus-veneris]